MVNRPSWAPDEVDISRPSVARVYDYYLGGSHNFEPDREFAEQVLQVLPDLTVIVQENRAFLRRAVRYLCAQGIDQFIDLGSGIPTVGNVHDVTRQVAPRARVVYVDNDPVAVTHSREILADNAGSVVVTADLCDPGATLGDPLLRGHLDLARPVAVLFVSVLHFVEDDRRPVELVAEYMRATAPASYLVISHASTDAGGGVVEAQEIYNRPGSPNPMRMRSRVEVLELFGGLTLVEPGMVPLPQWRPDSPDDVPGDVDRFPGYAGVARRD